MTLWKVPRQQFRDLYRDISNWTKAFELRTSYCILYLRIWKRTEIRWQEYLAWDIPKQHFTDLYWRILGYNLQNLWLRDSYQKFKTLLVLLFSNIKEYLTTWQASKPHFRYLYRDILRYTEQEGEKETRKSPWACIDLLLKPLGIFYWKHKQTSAQLFDPGL